MANPIKVGNHFPQKFQKVFSVLIIFVNIFTAITTRRYVIKRTRKFYSYRSSHDHRKLINRQDSYFNSCCCSNCLMDRHRHLFAFDTAYRLFGCHFDRRAYEKVSLLPISARTSLLYSVCWKKRFATPKKLALNFLSIGNDEVVVTTVEPEDAKAGQDKARFLSNPMVI